MCCFFRVHKRAFGRRVRGISKMIMFHEDGVGRVPCLSPCDAVNGKASGAGGKVGERLCAHRLGSVVRSHHDEGDSQKMRVTVKVKVKGAAIHLSSISLTQGERLPR